MPAPRAKHKGEKSVPRILRGAGQRGTGPTTRSKQGRWTSRFTLGQLREKIGFRQRAGGAYLLRGRHFTARPARNVVGAQGKRRNWKNMVGCWRRTHGGNKGTFPLARGNWPGSLISLEERKNSASRRVAPKSESSQERIEGAYSPSGWTCHGGKSPTSIGTRGKRGNPGPFRHCRWRGGRLKGRMSGKEKGKNQVELVATKGGLRQLLIEESKQKRPLSRTKRRKAYSGRGRRRKGAPAGSSLEEERGANHF